MTATNLNITVGNGASFASQGIGWISPTVEQPKIAGFFDLNNLSNMAIGGAAPVVGGSAPAFVAGVQGENVPYITVSPTSRLQFDFSCQNGLTIIALCAFNVPSGNTDDTILASSYGANDGNAVQIRSSSASQTHFYMELPGNYAYADLSDTADLSTWGIRTFTATIADATTTTSVLTMLNQNQMSGTSQSGGPSTGNAVFTSSPTLFVGCDGDKTGKGSVNINTFLAFDTALSVDDLASVVAILRARAASWGITV